MAESRSRRIARVRRRGDCWDVRYDDASSELLPVAVRGRFESAVSYGFDPDGALTTKRVSR